MLRSLATIAVLSAVLGCGREEALREPPPDAASVEVYWAPTDTLTRAEIEAGRRDSAWRESITLPSRPARPLPLDSIAVPETWREIGSVPDPPTRPGEVRLPVGGEAEGPSVLAVQVLLDRSGFSPGVVDGRWGKNTEKAVFWLQTREKLEPTGVADSTTYARLFELAGNPDAAVVERFLTEGDVDGPFVAIPRDVYRQARLPCLCYESLAEKLAERFHTTPDVLQELNPGVALDSLVTGDPVRVPDVGPVGADADTASARAGKIARIVISGLGFYLHTLDAEGRILHHFPTTLGSRYDPSPEGELRVVAIHPDPWFHYQPRLLAGVDPDAPQTHIPPGPNNLVGDTWIKLSRPHYGIHGTRAPETIGYVTSSGCVRMTNWDARFLRDRVEPGVPVVFEHTRGPEDPTPPPDSAVQGPVAPR